MNRLRAIWENHRVLAGSSALAVLLLSSAIAAVQIASNAEPPPAARRTISLQDATAALLSQGLTLEDADHDALPDVLETYVYGSDPNKLDTSGSGIPDGWLARYGYDPAEAGVGLRFAASPPGDLMPAVYGGEWKPAWRPTLQTVYAWGRPATWNETEKGPFENGLDPREWDNSGTGIPDGWLLSHGLDPTDADVRRSKSADDDLTIDEEFRAGTDPRLGDTDGDGLRDSDELRSFHTDPLRTDTAGGGVPDGWLVRHRLNATDPQVRFLDPVGKGLTTEQTYRYNVLRFGASGALAGQGLNPNQMSTLNGPIPDGWYVRYGLDPFEQDAASKVRWRASDWGSSLNLIIGVGNLAALPDLAWTYADKYDHDRPNHWNESRMGPWWQGLRPDTNDTDADGIPDVNEVRGWYLQRHTSIDPSAPPETVHVASNPNGNDTDTDELSDSEEYFGHAVRAGAARTFAPSDPSNRDTAFSGLSDAEKVFGVTRDNITYAFEGSMGLDPTRADSGESLLRDGIAFTYWHERYRRFLADTEYEFDESRYEHIGEFLPPGDTAQSVAKFRPDGDLDGDGAINLLDPDADNDGLPNGVELDPTLLTLRGPFTSPEAVTTFPRPSTDPSNPDTDGDSLPDKWEVEFAHWRSAASNWNLNPAQYSSFQDEVSDGERNLDGDTVTWWKFSSVPGGFDGTNDAFDHTNRREFEAGTDPNNRDEDLDGVSEGWRVFWGDAYPTLAQGTGDVGVLKPSFSDALVSQTRNRIRGIATGSLEDLVLNDLEYARFQESATGFSSGLFPPPRPGETVETIFQDTQGRPIPVIRGGGVENLYVARIGGTHVLGAAQAEREQANPYMVDTDGDTLPDAWESFYSCQTSSGIETPNPVRADAGLDPDGDGLSNREERAEGTDPCLLDTDLGGLPDGTELDLEGQFDPTDPTDDAAVLQSDLDSDGDGLRDADELLFLGLNPFNPDTDHDGLIEGSGSSGGDLDLFAPTDEARIEQLLPFGVAHSQQALADGRVRYRFLSEATFNTIPTDADTSGAGIPDGWLRYYGYDPNGLTATERAQLKARYEAQKPTWWIEPVHGVWWWGRDPKNSPASVTDLDQDGLHDGNGEDPFAASTHTTLYDGLDPPATLREAQRRGDCAGDVKHCRNGDAARDYDENGVPDALDRVPTRIVVTQMPSEVTKGKPFELVGRVDVDCAAAGGCAGQPPAAKNRVVVVSLAGAQDTILGVGLSDEEGGFAVSACVCGPRTVSLPPGVPVLGRVDGQVQLDSRPGEVPVGSGKRLRVSTYNTTATFYGAPAGLNDLDKSHPQYMEAVLASGTTVRATRGATVVPATTFTVQADTCIVPSLAATSVDRGTLVEGTVRLEDCFGLPVLKPILARWSGAAQPMAVQLTPRPEDSTATFAFLADPAGPGEYALDFAFPGEPGKLGASQTQKMIKVRFGTTVTAALPDEDNRVRAGDSLSVRGRVTVGANPPGVVSLRATMGNHLLWQGQTNSHGSFEFMTAPIPTLTPGDHVLTVLFDGTGTLKPSSAQIPLRMTAATVLLLTSNLDTMAVGEPIALEGTLETATGEPVPDSEVTLLLGGHPLGAAQTSSDGTFALETPWSKEIGTGTSQIVADFPGTDLLGASSTTKPVRIATGTSIRLVPASIPLGGGGTVTGSLVRNDNVALAGKSIDIRIGGETAGTTITDPDGSFKFMVAATFAQRVGPTVVEAGFSDAASQLFLPTQAQTTFFVKTASRLELDTAQAERQRFPMHGRLMNDVGDPLGGQLVRLEVLGRSLNVTTSIDGAFNATFTEGLDAPVGPVTWTATFDGAEHVTPASGTATNLLRASTSIAIVASTESSPGATLNMSVRLIEEGPRDAREIEYLVVRTGSHVLATRALEPNPTQLRVPLPADLALGPITLTIDFTGSALLFPSSTETRVELKRPAHLEVAPTSGRLSPGLPATFTATLLGPDGSPLPGVALGVTANSAPVPFRVTTDENGMARFDVSPPNEGDLILQVGFAGNAQVATASTSLTVPVAASASASSSSAPLRVPQWLLFGAGIVYLAGVAGLVAWARPRALLVRALDRALSRLEASDPYSASVLLAYKRLSVYLHRFGFNERPGETAREFVAALQTYVEFEPRHAETLVRLFERARYGVDDRLGQEEQLASAAALRHVRSAVSRTVRVLRGEAAA